MPKQLHLSCIIDLPDDVFAAAKATAKIEEPWGALLAALKDADVKHVHKLETLETRAKPEGARRGRRPNGTQRGTQGGPVAERAESLV